MPVFLFTYHAYGSWLPDREQGYVRRHEGQLACDQKMATRYRQRMKEEEKEFDFDVQRSVITSLVESQMPQRFSLYYVATESTHVHLLLGWRDQRQWKHMRTIVKTSITKYLNRTIRKCEWLSEGGSRKHVKDQEHFDYLIHKYLSDHRGWKWTPERGFFR